ncbi:SNF2-related protein [Bosea sp. 47.2.35]|uniref:SNF2-related protein n=1 Tax=Bosea sp. 47.2.35 TaxID=2969304 RepID=UPI00214FAD3E|nr:SNF2-related protein [Bosea sp. 47.2.35]MCR4522515.1 SNF2-related protein [Bosea sp. 47.2.35]
MTVEIGIDYDPTRVRGILSRSGDSESSPIWERIKARFASYGDVILLHDTVDLPWPEVLGVIREFGSASTQKGLGFRFAPSDRARAKVATFVSETKKARQSKDALVLEIDEDAIQPRLDALGYTRKLKPFQLRDLSRLLSLPHGANFSVPGAGKTSVTLALSLLAARPDDHLFVVAPKAAFPAWRGVVAECVEGEAPAWVRENFTVLAGTEYQNDIALRSGARRFLMSYDLLVRQQALIAAYFSRQSVHLVLDESHRMKAGLASQRGAFLINVASSPSRRDILSGTPMPQDASDIASQLGFLWPGQGYDLQIQRGVSPRQVLGQLYVRTTKDELGLTPAIRHFYDVSMADGQLALYGVVKNEILRQITRAMSNSTPDFLSARKSVMRLLQLSTNPTLALQAMTRDMSDISSGIADQVVEEGASLKMREVCAHARALAKEGKKSVIWTIFTQSILDLERILADLNPVSLYGAIPSGETSDLLSREGRLTKFHTDPNCKVLIANPAAAGEGISLHTVCHDAIYLDRSYVSTHYLQSIDRIHRLGLEPGVDTNIHIYRTKAPAGLGSVDLSVSRRLAHKIHGLEHLLDDLDLRQLALDEDNADDPVDYDVDMQDLVDLVEELEGRQPIEPQEEV